MSAAGVDPEKPLTLAAVVRGWCGDLRAERLKKVCAEARILEVEAARVEGESVPLSEVERIYAERLMPLREAIVAGPGMLAARCNPADPPHAHGVIGEWVDNLLRIGREGK